MKCSVPFVQGTAEFGCGQCMPCKMNRRRLWTARLMLEAQKHEFSCFVTLTYDEVNYPHDKSVSVRAVQLWLKRLRKLLHPRTIRYYAVGEYGARTGRAHYHAILYGVSEIDAPVIATSWGLGNVHVGTLTPESAAYVVSYVCKHVTAREKEMLAGRTPEFARMSLRPGIGASAIQDFARPIASGIDVNTGEFYGLPDGDVPGQFVFEGKYYPLGRYLRGKLRDALGLPAGEPVAVGELRNYRRFIDLRECGRRGYKMWQARLDERQQSQFKAEKHFEILLSKKGIGI